MTYIVRVIYQIFRPDLAESSACQWHVLLYVSCKADIYDIVHDITVLVYIVYYIVYIITVELCNVHYIVYIVTILLYIVYYIVYIITLILYNVYHIVYIVNVTIFPQAQITKHHMDPGYGRKWVWYKIPHPKSTVTMWYMYTTWSSCL